MRPGSLLLATAISLGLAAPASAQTYPTRSVRIIVPFVPGGATDVVARLYAEQMQTRFGQPVVVENRPGGNGIVGTEAVARAQPDGYTLLFAYPGALTVNPSLYAKLPYNPVKDFAPVSLLVRYPFVLTVNPAVPAKDLKEFIALAKSQPGKLTYGTAGIGTTSHLTMELFKREAGVDLLHVPFKGSGQFATEVIAGRLTASFDNVATTLGNIRSGKLRALGVSGTQRAKSAPEIPTIAEAGLPSYDVTGWFALVAPAGTPKDVLAKLEKETLAITNEPKFTKEVLDRGMEPSPGSAETLGKLIGSELTRWARVIKEANIKATE